MLSRLSFFALLLLLLLPSCSGSHAPADPVTVNMHFERAAFYDAPFPSDDLVQPDGSVAIGAYPNPDPVALVDQAKALVAGGARGFSETGGVYFSLTGAVDPGALPDMATSITPRASVFLMGVTQSEADGGPFGAPDLLSLLPLQGTPLRPRTTYAAVVLRAAGVAPSAEMASIAGGARPSAMPQAAFDEYRAALSSLAQAGVDAGDIAGLAVFTTDDPTAQLGAVYHDMLSKPLPQPDSPFHQTDLLPTYCVYEATIPMPDYQAGSPPYTFSDGGGAWAFDASGKPVQQRTEEAGVVVTIPRAPMPSGGWPVVHFLRTGGGGDRPLVDRGPQATAGGPPITPGTGPALYFAEAGFAGASVDGPHEGLRNLTNDNEDFLMFNVFNPPALRDNVRESAAEYALFARVLASLQIDVSDCPGTTSPARFDATRMGLMGHSMGATIAPLTLSLEPMYRVAVLSGAGASWIENIVWKQQPLDLAPAFELFLHYTQRERTLTENDAALTLLQWAEEPADPLVYTRALVAEPPPGQPARHVLMEQGIVDHYIMPPIANATSLSLGLDLAGAPLDATSAELTADGAPTLESELPFSGRAQIPLPASGNRSGVTAVVVQHPSDGIEDGHEIVFQTDPPKREYRCFLQTWAAGATPLVPAPGTLDGPCQ
jgi:hypothetical protein